jgi:hypothetical protein
MSGSQGKKKRKKKKYGPVMSGVTPIAKVWSSDVWCYTNCQSDKKYLKLA